VLLEQGPPVKKAMMGLQVLQVLLENEVLTVSQDLQGLLENEVLTVSQDLQDLLENEELTE
jgi:hypothetical protein